MDALEYAENVAGKTLNQLREAYDSQHERAYKLATLVVSGAGAAGVYALGKVGAADAGWVVWPLAALSCWWFATFGVILLCGAASKKLLAGATSDAIRVRLAKHSAGRPQPLTAESAEAALWLTRWDELAAIDKEINQYSTAASQRARALDRAVWCLVASPLIAAAAYAVAAWTTSH
jgi:hypothetical protein